MSAATALSGCAQVGRDASGTHGQSVPGGGDLVRRENGKAGTRDWMLTNTRIDPKTKYRCPWVEGYCSHTSIRPGEELRLFVSTNPPSPFGIDVYRMGYYAGAGGRQVLSLGPVKGATQPGRRGPGSPSSWAFARRQRPARWIQKIPTCSTPWA